MNEAVSAQSETKPNRFWSSIQWLVRCGMWLALFGFALSFLGRQFFVAELLANFRTQFCALFLVGLLLSRPVKASWLLFACLLISASFSGWESGKLFLPTTEPAPGQTKVRVMSFNVLATSMQFDSTIAEIRKHDPDVVAVLEYANMWHIAMDALNESYPHQHREPRWHGYGIAIFSKLPLENAKSIPLTEDAIDNPAASVNIRIDDQLVRIMAVHVMSPIKRYRMELRNRQFKEIAGHVNAESSPTVLVGDMNCSTSSGFLADMIRESKLRDSRQGFGIHPSWPSFAGPFAVPIDHVLVSDTIHVHDRFPGDAAGSDHRPVIIDFSVATENK